MPGTKLVITYQFPFLCISHPPTSLKHISEDKEILQMEKVTEDRQSLTRTLFEQSKITNRYTYYGDSNPHQQSLPGLSSDGWIGSQCCHVPSLFQWTILELHLRRASIYESQPHNKIMIDHECRMTSLLGKIRVSLNIQTDTNYKEHRIPKFWESEIHLVICNLHKF